MIIMFIDTHAHMDHSRFSSDRKAILKSAKDSGIGFIMNPAIGFETNMTMEKELDAYDWIYYAKGIHPNSLGTDDTVDEKWEKHLIQCIENNAGYRIAAIGETGLDFHRLSRTEYGGLDETGVITLSRQYKWFRKQLKLAARYGLAVVLHIRNANEEAIRSAKGIPADICIEHIDAHKEAIKILAEFQDDLLPSVKGVIHCFTGKDIEDANKYISMGYMLGIGGAVTYENNVELRKIVREVPLKSIVLETDAPYVMPEGLNGKRNTPLNIPYIAKCIADIKGISVKEVEDITTANAIRLFRF